MAENDLERDGDVQRTHQQQQNGELDGVPAQPSQRQPVFLAQQWCEIPPPCPSSPEYAAAAQMMVSLQEIFFDWCVSSLALTGGLETLPVESTSRDDLVPEEGGELRYECERLLAPQHVGKIDPCSPEVDTAQLGMECSCMEPFATERGRQEEEDTMSMQLERSQVEANGFPRRLAETARIVTVITDEPWTGSSSSLQDKFCGHAASSSCRQSAGMFLAEKLKFAIRDEVVFGQDPAVFISRDVPTFVLHHKRAIRRARIKKLFRSHRPRLRPRTRWKFVAPVRRSVNHCCVDWVHRFPSGSDLLAVLPGPENPSRVRKLTFGI
ncbi:uncharacterized protein LOC120423631 [Culex pipiens pallens]|uniref:uncharacterized protein LOC120423631 n=1 Tax=Culex pipiens pallens TaxID=42434 RepID=UPI001954F188|nr:uncharacterized protein LOC120423631 [Culex pipiens pallens]